MTKKQAPITPEKWFDDLKKQVLRIDPVSFCENYLMLDGAPFRLDGGWKFLIDIYRYIAVKALEPDGKPVVCVKGRQVGATTMAAALELFFCASGMFGSSLDRPPIRILHCFPSLALVNRFAKLKLGVMMRESKDNYIAKQSLSLNDESGKRRIDVPDDTQTEKLFKNGNILIVESNSNNAQRLHGMSLDCIFYDEVQRMHQDDIGNSQRTLTSARYGPRGKGIQLFFGTPLLKGSNFHKLWEASDQRLYHLRCEKCQEYFPLYIPGSDDWEKVWVTGNIVACRHCNHQQDKIKAVENGKWIPMRPSLENGNEPTHIGFHFNQLLIPYFTKETILNEKPGIHPTNSEKTWKCEILGEFYSGSELPMSEDEIYKYCRGIGRRISFGYPNIIKGMPGASVPLSFMGLDWGQKSDNSESSVGKSFSSVVIVSADKNGTLFIENAFKLKSQDFEHKKDVVREMYRRYDVKIAVADLGYGSDIVPELQKEFGGRMIGAQSSGSLNNPIKYDPELLRMIINPHNILDEIFGNMRKSKFIFPWEDYEKIHWLIEHCCSMEKKESFAQGRMTSKYVKGSGPNDGLMALMYAYLAFKFYLTQGFKIKAHQLGTKQTGPILAYVPGM